jgi:hypothetical protein
MSELITWDQVRADRLSEGDRVLWRTTRTIESVAGNEYGVRVTFDDGEDQAFGRTALVWKADRTSERSGA